MHGDNDLTHDTKNEKLARSDCPSGIPRASKSIAVTKSGEFIHRVVQADGQRFSLKLEQPYWTVLQEVAEEEKIPVARLVQRISKEVPDGASLTATLRLFCLETVRSQHSQASNVPPRIEETSDLTVSSAPPLERLINFFRFSSSPGLLLNPREEILYVNPAFESWSRLRKDHLIGKPVTWHFQIRMPKPVSNIISEFRSGASNPVMARVSYISPGRITVANAFVSLLLWQDSKNFIWSVMINEKISGNEKIASVQTS